MGSRCSKFPHSFKGHRQRRIYVETRTRLPEAASSASYCTVVDRLMLDTSKIPCFLYSTSVESCLLLPSRSRDCQCVHFCVPAFCCAIGTEPPFAPEIHPATSIPSNQQQATTNRAASWEPPGAETRSTASVSRLAASTCINEVLRFLHVCSFWHIFILTLDILCNGVACLAATDTSSPPPSRRERQLSWQRSPGKGVSKIEIWPAEAPSLFAGSNPPGRLAIPCPPTINPHDRTARPPSPTRTATRRHLQYNCETAARGRGAQDIIL
ncbi:hypothetical protein BT67DRAFT_45250 [Trichocladium antarcticum]|uniref:Uncharacterized protein n=1 Tax=Trichocladium antarcticum TaxID=1450529 RepID=A0AAN6UI73_9PEZI|nr:hypothetical protein BT67DRAFT_45250 [Trichocladium antarcticum]